MKIRIIGAGPAGLYLARLRKLHHPEDVIDVLEQNARGTTYGFGVSIAEKAVDRYESVDPVLAQRITAASLPLPDQRFTLDDASYVLSSTQYGAAIERQQLLQIMADACAEVGVRIHHGQRIDDASRGGEVDLVVGADGANSIVLAQGAGGFQPRYGLLRNRFAWFGVGRRLPEAGLSFRRHGPWQLVGHYYPYTAGLSTFVAEVDGATWEGGFSALPEAERKALFEQVFARELEGARLIENRSVWRQFRHVENAHWHDGNRVLLGDALAVAHYSIGSGTRLAMDDALALFDALEAHGSHVAQALPAFEAARRPVREKLTSAARRSWDWYEDVGRHARLPLMGFIHSFMSRTGRMSPERLAKAMPTFAADHAAWLATQPSGTAQPCA